MSSNNSNSPIRMTFSTKDSNHKQYPDIISAFLLTATITATDFDNGYLLYNAQKFLLHCPKAVRIELGLYGNADVIISYQIRTTGCYAITRIYKGN